MIAVLKHGNCAIVKCEECSAVLKYNDEDIHKSMFDYIICPECKHCVYV